MRKNSRIPNFRNLGIHLRVLLLHVVTLAMLTAVTWRADVWLEDLSVLALRLLPPLLLSLGALYVVYPVLQKLSFKWGMSGVVCIAFSASILMAQAYANWVHPLTSVAWIQVSVLCLADLAVCLYYLDLLQRAYSPAIAEARLQALQARIRPHFLFNSLNAVISLVRNQPKRAENALEDMAELFRVLMAENRDLVPLAREIEICKQYLNIEKLRLDERLTCEWLMDDVPQHSLIPPLILQPLLENAVYHGIERLSAGGKIVVQMQQQGQRLHIRISNPLPTASDGVAGNRMAMKNIQERLRLHYDLEASFKQTVVSQQYVVELLIPTADMHGAVHG